MERPALLPMWRKVCCGFVSPLKIRLGRVRTRDLLSTVASTVTTTLPKRPILSDRPQYNIWTKQSAYQNVLFCAHISYKINKSLRQTTCVPPEDKQCHPVGSTHSLGTSGLDKDPSTNFLYTLIWSFTKRSKYGVSVSTTAWGANPCW
jgi:hypothetical protein